MDHTHKNDYLYTDVHVHSAIVSVSPLKGVRRASISKEP